MGSNESKIQRRAVPGIISINFEKFQCFDLDNPTLETNYVDLFSNVTENI